MGYVEELRALVGHRPLIFVGACVIILNEEGEILLQQRKEPRRGSWSLPGGLMELGESVEETARREVFEETNLTIGKLELINVYSGPQNFIKAANGDEFYVVTIAFYTKEFSGELIVDPLESLDFKFFNFDELPHEIVKSHQVIINEYLEKKGS